MPGRYGSIAGEPIYLLQDNVNFGTPSVKASSPSKSTTSSQKPKNKVLAVKKPKKTKKGLSLKENKKKR